MALSRSGETLYRVDGSMLAMFGVIMMVTEMDLGSKVSVQEGRCLSVMNSSNAVSSSVGGKVMPISPRCLSLLWVAVLALSRNRD